MTWKNILKQTEEELTPEQKRARERIKQGLPSKIEGPLIPEWDDEKNIAKEESKILTSLDSKQKKKLKKTLQAAKPTEYFGQDFTQLGDLIEMMEGLDLVKDDNKMKKKMKSISEQNVDMVATASKLRKQYEQLYRQVRKIVYPKSAGSLRDDEK